MQKATQATGDARGAELLREIEAQKAQMQELEGRMRSLDGRVTEVTARLSSYEAEKGQLEAEKGQLQGRCAHARAHMRSNQLGSGLPQPGSLPCK
jgi:chromosome segregation ATPase